MEFLDLKVGEQDHLMAARNLMKWKTNEYKVIIVAHAAKQMGALAFVKNFKFCYDEADETVYCLAHLDGLAVEKRCFYYHVAKEFVTFFQVKSIVERKNSRRDFLNMDIRIRVCIVSLSYIFLVWLF
jgi:hypothetical protein